eukprot:scaffold313674_cov18-Tisochrysis_lutea.AAC.2
MARAGKKTAKLGGWGRLLKSVHLGLQNPQSWGSADAARTQQAPLHQLCWRGHRQLPLWWSCGWRAAGKRRTRGERGASPSRLLQHLLHVGCFESPLLGAKHEIP